MEGSSQPVDLEGLFADWLARSGAEEEFETLCREHGEHASALRELHAYWQRLRSILSRAGLGISREQGDSFALRLEEQYGSGVDPAIALERGEEAAPSSQLLALLAEHSFKGSRYQLRGELARGGMGAILEVWDEDLRRSLAMKVILGKTDGAPSGNTPPVDRRLLARFPDQELPRVERAAWRSVLTASRTCSGSPSQDATSAARSGSVMPGTASRTPRRARPSSVGLPQLSCCSRTWV